MGLQVIKVQRAALGSITAHAREHMQQGQRELSRNVLAPTIQVCCAILQASNRLHDARDNDHACQLSMLYGLFELCLTC